MERYFEVIFENNDSICILGRRKPSLSEAEDFVKKDMERAGWEVVTSVEEIQEEEAIHFFNMEEKESFPVFGEWESKNRICEYNLGGIVLKDDSSGEGGVSFAGETAEDFLLEIAEENEEKMAEMTVLQFNEALAECGIVPLSAEDLGEKLPSMAIPETEEEKGR